MYQLIIEFLVSLISYLEINLIYYTNFLIDSQNNYLCYDKDKPCPFNKFSMDIKERKLQDTVIHFGNGTNLLFGREKTNDKILFYSIYQQG